MKTGNIEAAREQQDRAGCSPASVRYQAVCSLREEGDCTYGLQCLEDRMGCWILLDSIEDISPSRDSVLTLVARFNTLQLSPLHFRDVVLDCVSA